MTAPNPTLASSRRDAFAWARRACVVLVALALGVLGLERLVLRYPARLGRAIEGFPVETVDALAHVRGDIVYIGDSVVQTVATPDSDHRLLPDIVARELGEPIVRISQAATGAEVHAAWLAYLADAPVAPRAVVIAVNPRSCSPHWELNPGWVFTDLAVRTRHPLLGRLASVLEWDWGRPSAEAYAATEVRVAGNAVGTIALLDQGIGGDPARITHDRYLVRYAADYSESRRIDSIRALVAQASAQPFPVVLYLTPVDVEAARAELADEEMAAVEANLELLRREVFRSRWPVVDALELVAHVDFDHGREDPHEHLRGPGRIAVAELVAGALRTALDLPAEGMAELHAPTISAPPPVVPP